MKLRDYLTYDHTSVENFTVNNDVFEEIGSMVTVERESGTYELKISMSHTLDSTVSSAFFRYSLDGGSTWINFSREARANTDILLDTYIDIINHSTGIFEISVEARKEVATDTLIIKNLNIIFERKY